MKKLLAMILVVGVLFGAPIPASAQDSSSTQARWIDAATIEFRGVRYYDRNPFDDANGREHAKANGGADCGNFWYDDDRTGGQAEIRTVDEFGDCTSVESIQNITFRNSSQGFIAGYRNSPTEIMVYVPANSGGRANLVTLEASTSNPNAYYYRGSDGTLDNRGHVVIGPNGEMAAQDSLADLVDGDYNGFRLSDQPPAEDTVSDYQNLGAGEEDNSCESNSGVLGWIMCPVAGILDSATGFLDNEIEEKLMLKDDYFRGESGDGLKAVWTQIRNLSYVVLIPIMLLMVIGTALGFEVFSAYTIKKALPRMVIAVIFITLSWYICLFIVDFVNVLGTGIKGLVLAPFNELVDGGPRSSLKSALDMAGVTSSGSSGFESAATGTALGLAGAGAVYAGFATGALGISIIMSTLFTAVIILGAVFLLLIARQMILIALLLVAPLAILAWIFPGNDKLWKLWWGGFSKLLLLFPVIMLVIAVGQIFAFVAGLSRGESDNGLVTSIIIIAAYILPYFFIPFTFKWAGGLFGNIAGMVNDSERGVLDRLKKGRAERRSQGWSNFKAGTGTGFGQTNALTRRVGTGIGAGIGGGKGVFGTGFTQAQRARGQARMDQMNRLNSVEGIMKNPAWNGVNQDDTALHAGVLLQDMDAAQAKEKLISEGVSASEADRGIAAWQATGMGGRAAAIAAAQQLVSTGTGYKNLDHMSRTLGRAAGGNFSTASALAGFANAETKKVGRGDLAPGFGNLDSLVKSEVMHSKVPDAGVKPTTAEYDANIVTASRGQDPVTLLRGKPKEMQNLANALEGHLGNQHAKSLDMSLTEQERLQATDEMLRTAAQIEKFNQSKSYASDENQEIVNRLMSRTIDIRRGGEDGTLPGNVADRIQSDPTIKARWQQLNPRPRNPNDPNLPE